MAPAQSLPRVRPASGLEARVAGGMFLVLSAGFMTVIMVAASIAPGYDYAGAAISDLGTVPETALLFNLSLVALGLLNAGGGYLFYRSHGRVAVLIPFLLAGMGAMGAGLFPLDGGGPHGLFALLAFIFFNLEAIGVGAVVHGAMRIVSVGAGVLGLVYVVLMVLGDGGNGTAFGPIGHGGTERMIVYPAMLWMLALAGYLMRSDDALA